MFQTNTPEHFYKLTNCKFKCFTSDSEVLNFQFQKLFWCRWPWLNKPFLLKYFCQYNQTTLVILVYSGYCRLGQPVTEISTGNWIVYLIRISSSFLSMKNNLTMQGQTHIWQLTFYDNRLISFCPFHLIMNTFYGPINLRILFAKSRTVMDYSSKSTSEIVDVRLGQVESSRCSTDPKF